MTTSPPPVDPSRPEPSTAAVGWSLGLILVAGLLLRSLHADQPILENYVGRQVPTAMVARNIERGSGFLRPQLDTGPFPNFFLVEPPVYQEAAVGLRRLTQKKLDECGRWASALAATLGAWGCFALVARRAGARAGLAAAAAFSMLPITLRYGRAFQPDVFSICACTAGLAFWDGAAGSRRPVGRLASGWALLALGLAAKATAAFLLPVAFLFLLRPRSWRSGLLCVSTLAPVLAWYAWAHHLAASGEGSRAAADNQAIWMRLVGVGALLKGETWSNIVAFLLVRAFTPLGVPLAAWGIWIGSRRSRDGLWAAWAGLAMLTMLAVAAKLHHEYYWLCLAPVAAAGLGLAWDATDRRRPVFAFAATLAFGALCLWSAASTWRTPLEWADVEEARQAIATVVGTNELVVAPEALLYQADRKGCRLEYTNPAAARAAGEWGEAVTSPMELVSFYRSRGARWLADVGAADDEARSALHEAIRRRYKVVIDRPDAFLADIAPSEPPPYAD